MNGFREGQERGCMLGPHSSSWSVQMERTQKAPSSSLTDEVERHNDISLCGSEEELGETFTYRGERCRSGSNGKGRRLIQASQYE